MTDMSWNQTRALLAVAGALALGALLHAGPQQPGPDGARPDPAAALKQSLQQGMALARKYEWIETTIISLKGEEKARTQKRCYYGADGKVQKIAIEQPQAQAQEEAGGARRGGRRGAAKVKETVIENKKDEMKEYMQKAAALIHQYVPPNPQQIQAAKEAGRLTVTPQPGGPARIAISQYLLPGDSLNIDFDPAANRLLGLAVNSYIDKAEDTVTLVVQMATLPDGALYAGQTTLQAKAKNITVVIQNSGHRPVQP